MVDHHTVHTYAVHSLVNALYCRTPNSEVISVLTNFSEFAGNSLRFLYKCHQDEFYFKIRSDF